MSIPLMTNDLEIIQKLSDLPNSTDGLTAAQLKAKFDEAPLAIQTWINQTLIPSIVAAKIPFSGTTEIDATDVDGAIRAVHQQIKDAATGTLINGSVTKEKLSEELLNRTYGGRPWVGLETPGSAQNQAADFPVGQIWLRPPFTVSNLAGSSWSGSGCSAAATENRITVTGNRTVTAASITQTLSNVGQAGDRVFVLFDIADRDANITAMTVAVNSGEAVDVGSGVVTTELVGTALTVVFRITWPSTSLASGKVSIVNYTVVNVDAILRQAGGAADMSDWTTYLTELLPLNTYSSPEEVYIHTTDGEWWPLGLSRLPISRGGTGITAVGSGDLLYGNGGEDLSRLPAGADGTFLRIKNGTPRWGALSEITDEGGYLRVQTGSYTGNGSVRTISLGVTPVALMISPVGGVDSGVLMQGCDINKTYTGTTSGGSRGEYTAGIRLNNGSLSTYMGGRYNNYTDAAAQTLNASGVTYKWAAIY